jgi:predicted metal-dependent hydrolase
VEYRKLKTIRLTVHPPDGRVKIAAPIGMDREQIRTFAVSKIAWIEKHRERYLKHSKINSSLKNHSAVYIWGTAYKLEIIERKGNSKIKVEGGNIKLYVRPDSTKAKKLEILDKWYHKILEEVSLPIIKKWEAIIGVEVKKLYVRKMKTHWGSCNGEKQTLRLNSELAKRNPVYLEYVIVHEMLHIIEKSHNRRFYSLLNKYLPGWKETRKKMNAGL